MKKIPFEKTNFSFKDIWKGELSAGFLVFILALPLSLGIAKASGFPPAMGVLTAMIGGMFTYFFRSSPLTIKGPAAGLITICAAAVTEFGGGDTGWKIACALIIVMALIQILFGFLKFGVLSDFFPHSAVHGMLAAIGIIIIAKQVPVLLGDEPSLYKGEGPIQLLLDIPTFVTHAHWHIAAVGILGLVVLFGMPKLKIDILKKIPAPMIVLLFTVPLAVYWHFKDTEQSYSLVHIGDFFGNIIPNPDFSVIASFAFWKYVFMFLFVSSLESLLTVKAIDNLDPYKRSSNYNGDLIAQGAGNALSGLLGGLPMISEVVRSSANVGFGAKTKLSNLFHGIFLFLSMVLLIPVIELIPNAALASMLIYAGFRLAAPKEFIHTYKIGKEQLAIFLVTIIVTLAEDLLLGVACGILVKFLFHLYHGASLKTMFKAVYEKTESPDHNIVITIKKEAIFSNLIAFKGMIGRIEQGKKIVVDIHQSNLIDHSFMAFLTHYAKEYNQKGGDFSIIGLETHKALSDHPLSTRILKKQLE